MFPIVVYIVAGPEKKKREGKRRRRKKKLRISFKYGSITIVIKPNRNHTLAFHIIYYLVYLER